MSEAKEIATNGNTCVLAISDVYFGESVDELKKMMQISREYMEKHASHVGFGVSAAKLDIQGGIRGASKINKEFDKLLDKSFFDREKGKKHLMSKNNLLENMEKLIEEVNYFTHVRNGHEKKNIKKSHVIIFTGGAEGNFSKIQEKINTKAETKEITFHLFLNTKYHISETENIKVYYADENVDVWDSLQKKLKDTFENVIFRIAS